MDLIATPKCIVFASSGDNSYHMSIYICHIKQLILSPARCTGSAGTGVIGAGLLYRLDSDVATRWPSIFSTTKRRPS